MALRHILYRCPLCGHDPMQGKRNGAFCPSCGAAFQRAPQGVRIRTSGDDRVVSVAHLVDRIHGHGGPMSAATRGDGSIHHSAEADYLGFVTEEPLWEAGRLLGYVERPGAPSRGVLTVTRDGLAFQPADGQAVRWPLSDLTALQVSTGSLQVGIRRTGTVQFKLRDASTYRWEQLLQTLLRQEWQSAGRGEISEFQPQITDR